MVNKQTNKKLLLLTGLWQGQGCSSVGQSVRLACRCDRFDSLLQQGTFLSESTLSADTRTVSVHPCVQQHAFNIFAHVKDPVVHVTVQWIVETLKHGACTVGWVATLWQLTFPRGKLTQISHRRNPNRTVQFQMNQ